MRRLVLSLALSIGVSSCSSCESCKGGAAKDAGPEAASAPTASASASAAPSASAAIDPNFACRTLARAITGKACDCPQKNKMGCCYFGAPGVGAEARAPYVSCAAGKTDWPAITEEAICKVGKDEKKRELLLACYAVKEKLRCGRSEAGDVGAEVPRECETLLKEASALK